MLLCSPSPTSSPYSLSLCVSLLCSRFCSELQREEEDDMDQFLTECDADPTLRDRLSLLSRTFQDRRRQLKEERLSFSDNYITVEPLVCDVEWGWREGNLLCTDSKCFDIHCRVQFSCHTGLCARTQSNKRGITWYNHSWWSSSRKPTVCVESRSAVHWRYSLYSSSHANLHAKILNNHWFALQCLRKLYTLN